MELKAALRLLTEAVCPSASFLLPLSRYGWRKEMLHGKRTSSSYTRQYQQARSSGVQTHTQAQDAVNVVDRPASRSRRPRPDAVEVMKQRAARPRSRKVANNVASHFPNFVRVVHDPKRQNAFKQLLLLRSSLSSDDLESVLRIYPQLLSDNLISRSDTHEIVRLLHYFSRKAGRKTDDEIKQLLAHTQAIIQHLKTGALPPHRAACMQLISIFKDLRAYNLGVSYWKWLAQKNDDFINAASYGAAIELLNCKGEPLENLEDLYSLALKQFPGTFSEYHLSPGAIISDRARPVIAKGNSMTLIQGITTARVDHGDWRNAYLALDTALRLYPTQVPPRILDIFIHKRPLPEGYKVFQIACRSGILVNARTFHSMLDALAATQSIDGDIWINFSLTKAILNAMLAFRGAGGQFDIIQLNIIMKSMLVLLPSRTTEQRNDGATSADDRLYGTITEVIHSVIKVFVQQGIIPDVATWSNVIIRGGQLKREALVDLGLKSFVSSGTTANRNISSAMLFAGGELGDAELIKRGWSLLKQAASLTPFPLTHRHWVGLVTAARNAHIKDYVVTELSQDSQLGITKVDTIKRLLSEETSPSQAIRPHTEVFVLDNRITEQIGQISHIVRRVFELISSSKRHNFFQHPVPTSIWPSSADTFLPDPSSRDFYDQLTTDPQTVEAQTASEQTIAASSTTGYALDELRFQNWQSINELLATAEANEKLRHQEVSRAIEADKPLRQRDARLLPPDMNAALWRQVESTAIQRVRPAGPHEAGNTQNHKTPTDWQNEVLMLRGMDPPADVRLSTH
ncbi:MAG: hypothetical protein M1827_004904 [Pycnora praestabilis]|nr:MAG: hypothetical protein M1827_004904 [Pycnora praestabilis]